MSEYKGESKASSINDEVYKEFAKTTTNVVQQAASILEEEIAAGIIAAKKVEEHLIDVEGLRSEEPDKVMQRFRHDAHEVVDILVDLVNIGIKSIHGLSQNIITIRSGTNQEISEKMGVGHLPTITVPHSIKAGESVEIPLSLENNGDIPTDEFTLYSTELVFDDDKRISASQIIFTPPSLIIDSNQTGKVIVTVSIPEETETGTYSGLILATNMNQLRSVIIVQVD